MRTGLQEIVEIKKEVELQLNRMKLDPIENKPEYLQIGFICNYNSSSLVYMRKHWKMTFEINGCGWVIGLGEMYGRKFEISMNNK